MRPRIKLTRIHQINGPDYWQTDCYIEDHTLQGQGMSQQKALNDMYLRIDEVLNRDWYLAHWLNEFYNEEKEEETNAERIAREYGSSSPIRVRLWPNQTNTPVEPKGFFSWLKNLFN